MATTTRPRRSKPKAAKARPGPPQVGADGHPYRPDVAPAESFALACGTAFGYALTQGGEHTEEHFLKGLVDGMDLAGLAARLAARGSPFAENAEQLLALAAQDVSTACGRFADDPQMRALGQAAKACEDWCVR